MHSKNQFRNLLFRTISCAATAAQALAILLVAAVLATGSAQAQSPTYSVLYTFTGSPDGAQPAASLLQDAQGNLYGTTSGGGDPACTNGCGTVFKLDTTGKETLLYTFTGGGDGAKPLSSLVQDAQGNLYGTNHWGGDLVCANGCGTVFKVDTTGKETVLYKFTGSPDGATPRSGLVRDAQGNLYGTTSWGGEIGPACTNGCGTVFKVDPTGKETLLFSFAGTGGDGAGPLAGLVRDAQGILYGTTLGGGAYGAGTVFKLDTTGKETVLYSFTGTGGDGRRPTTRLVRDAQGNLYGTTDSGGDSNDDGTVFKVDTTGKETVLCRFTGTGGDGTDPQGDLVQDAQGNLYGTTWGGGVYSAGTVFKVDTTGKETVLYSFNGGADGGYPIGPGVVQDALGNLYGATNVRGAPENAGTVFKLSAAVLPSQVATTASGLAYSRVTQTFNGTVTIQNISGSPINGPFQIFFMGLNAGVMLANATGSLYGSPYLTVPGVASLAPGQKATVTVQFKDPSNAPINFTPVIYSGSF